MKYYVVVNYRVHIKPSLYDARKFVSSLMSDAIIFDPTLGVIHHYKDGVYADTTEVDDGSSKE